MRILIGSVRFGSVRFGTGLAALVIAAIIGLGIAGAASEHNEELTAIFTTTNWCAGQDVETEDNLDDRFDIGDRHDSITYSYQHYCAQHPEGGWTWRYVLVETYTPTS